MDSAARSGGDRVLAGSPCRGCTASSAPRTDPPMPTPKVEEAKPYDPKQLMYEVFGPPGTVANISYFDADAEPTVC